MLQFLSILFALPLGISAYATDLLIEHRAYTQVIAQFTLVDDASQLPFDAIALLDAATEPTVQTQQTSIQHTAVRPSSGQTLTPTLATTPALLIFSPGFTFAQQSRPPPTP